MESAQILLSLRVEKVDGIWTKVKADLRAIGNAAAQRLRQIHRGNPKNHILTAAGDVKMILAAIISETSTVPVKASEASVKRMCSGRMPRMTS